QRARSPGPGRAQDRPTEHLEPAADADDGGATAMLAGDPASQPRVTQPSQVRDGALAAGHDDEIEVTLRRLRDPFGPLQKPEVSRVRNAREPDDGDARTTWGRVVR